MDAEDLFSQVCVKIMEKYDNSVVHFYSWAKKITYNTHLDNIRKKYIKNSKGEKFRIRMRKNLIAKGNWGKTKNFRK